MISRMTDEERLEKIRKNPPPTQYIKVVKDLTFDDYAGRRTEIFTDSDGYILDEEQIDMRYKESATRKAKMIKECMETYNQEGAIYALVGGYPCKLMPDDYTLIDQPHRCCGELI